MRHFLMVSLIALSAAFMPALAAASLEGSWRGSGIVTHRGGADPVRCRVTFYKSEREVLRGVVAMRHRDRPLRGDGTRG